MINHRFGGIGTAKNLIPGSKQNNADHLSKFESKIKDVIGNAPGKDPIPNKKPLDKVIWMTSEVTYGSDWADNVELPSQDVKKADYAKSVLFKFGYYKNETWDKANRNKAAELELPLDITKPQWGEILKAKKLRAAAKDKDFMNYAIVRANNAEENLSTGYFDNKPKLLKIMAEGDYKNKKDFKKYINREEESIESSIEIQEVLDLIEALIGHEIVYYNK